MEEYSQRDYDMYYNHGGGYGSYVDDQGPPAPRRGGGNRARTMYGDDDPDAAFMPKVVSALEPEPGPPQPRHNQRVRRDAFGMERHIAPQQRQQPMYEEEDEEDYYQAPRPARGGGGGSRMKHFDLGGGGAREVSFSSDFGYNPSRRAPQPPPLRRRPEPSAVAAPKRQPPFKRKLPVDTGAGLFPPGEELGLSAPPARATRIGQGSLAPVEKRAKSSLVVPYGVHMSVTTLLQNAPVLGLEEHVKGALQFLLECDNESIGVDPYVELSDTVINAPTNTCKVLMREVVPVSQLLLARALQCTYGVNFTRELRSAARTYKEDVTVTPYEGATDTELGRSQDFGIEQAIRAALITKNLDPVLIAREVDAFMAKLGDLSSAKASSHEFLEEQLKEFGSIVAGTKSHLRDEMGDMIK